MKRFTAFLFTALAASAATCDIRDYGAPKSPAVSATRAVQSAIDACHAQGGGTVIVPPGEHLIGTIVLKDNIDLHVEAGATLVATQDAAEILPDSRAIVFANGAKNIAISGRGAIDGRARYEWSPAQGVDNMIAAEIEIARKAGLDMRRWNHAGLTNYLVQLVDCRNVHIRDVRLLNSQLWTVRLLNCDGVFVRGVTIRNDPEKAVNGDGIDVVSTRNAVISDCNITTGDDSICLKTARVDGKALPTENVTVTNCVLQSSSAALKIGTETFADIRHVVFSNSTIRDTNKGMDITVQDGGVVSDVIFANLTIDLSRKHWNWWGSADTFEFVLRKRSPQSALGAIRNVVVRGVISNARGTSKMIGYEGRPLENITIDELQIAMSKENTPDQRATDAIFADRVDGLQLRNVEVRWADAQTEPGWSSALSLRRVRGLEIDSFRGRQGLRDSQAPVIALDGVEDAWIRNVFALPGTGTIFGVRGATRAVRIDGVDARHARRQIEFTSPELRNHITVH